MLSTQAVLNRKMSKKTGRKYAERQKTSEVEKPLLDQFQTGELQVSVFCISVTVFDSMLT